eukprot:m.155832 g.155832  ORF g.155832 m.155832 type:complete len:51 (+) comp16284_c2_seq1:380-532(+)
MESVRFRLSATLIGHTGDVRGACASSPNAPVQFIATASRDQSGKYPYSCG